MNERIHYKRLKNALIRFGKERDEEAKSTLTKQKHVDTGKLNKSIKSYLEELDGGVRQILNLEFISYGQFADRWFKKSSIRKVKVGKRWVKKGVRDRPTFIEDYFGNVDELNDIIEDSAKEDLEDNINEYINDFNKK